MKRSAVALIILLVTSACSDGPHGASLLSGPSGPRIAILDELDTAEELIDALFRQGNATAAQARWSTVQRFAQRGDVTNARKHAFDLADFLVKKQRQGQLLDPDGSGDATTQDGVSRLLAILLGAAFPDAPAPAGDAVVALVDGSAQTVVTPLKRAGIELDAGSTPNPFLLVIDADPAPYYQRCAGPLDTTRCQFPLFYRFTPYPDTRLTKPATFGVCTMEQEHPYGPWGEAQHERMRLAHNLGDHEPTDPARVVDGIEVLSHVDVDFLECEEIGYGPPVVLGLGAHPVLGGGLVIASRIAGALKRVLAPKNAYAIDRGGGGEAEFFSPFNAVDTGTVAGTADFATSQVSATPAVAMPGEPVKLLLTITNAGTADAPPAQFTVRLVGIEFSQQIGGPFNLAALPAGGTFSGTVTVDLPEVGPGAYQVQVVADAANAVPELSETNNSASTPLLVPNVADGQTFPLATQGTAIVDGVMGATEWANGVCRQLTFNAPGGTTTTGKVCAMSDQQNIYFGLTYARPVEDPGHTLAIEVDGEGSSDFFQNDTFLWSGSFTDGVRLSESAPSDAQLEGTNDGAGGMNISVPVVVYELSHPLNSGDSYDISKSPGGVLRFFLSLRMIGVGGVYPADYGDTDWPGYNQFATVNLAPGTPIP